MHVLNLLLTITIFIQATAHASQPNRNVCLSPEQVVRDIAAGRPPQSLKDDLANARRADERVELQLMPMESKEIDGRLAELIRGESPGTYLFRKKDGKVYTGTLDSRTDGVVYINGTDGKLYGIPQSELFSVYKSTEMPAVYGNEQISSIEQLIYKGGRPEGVSNGYSYNSASKFATWNGGDLSAMPMQGYKLHISPVAGRALEAAEVVLPLLRKLGVNHKIVRSLDNYASLSGSQVGKLITIYPSSPAQAKKVADELTKALQKRGLTPRDFQAIPGEARVPGSLGVSTRYGQLRPIPGIPVGKIIKLNKNGHVVDAIGDELIINGKFATLDELEAELDKSAGRELLLEALEGRGFIVDDIEGTEPPSWAPNPF